MKTTPVIKWKFRWQIASWTELWMRAQLEWIGMDWNADYTTDLDGLIEMTDQRLEYGLAWMTNQLCQNGSGVRPQNALMKECTSGHITDRITDWIVDWITEGFSRSTKEEH